MGPRYTLAALLILLAGSILPASTCSANHKNESQKTGSSSVGPVLSDTVPKDWIKGRFNASAMKDGEKACVFPISASLQNHVWFDVADATRPPCTWPILLTKIKYGWKVTFHFEVYPINDDLKLKGLGYTRATEVEIKEVETK